MLEVWQLPVGWRRGGEGEGGGEGGGGLWTRRVRDIGEGGGGKEFNQGYHDARPTRCRMDSSH